LINLEIQTDDIWAAIFQMNVKKAAGSERMNFKAIRYLSGWDRKSIVALVQTAIRLGQHLKEWMRVSGVVISKPGKPKEYLAKASRVIALRNYIGKSVSKLVVTKITDNCERKLLLDDCRHRCNKQRLAVRTVGRWYG
jgi:hypothetical protein